VKIWSNAQLKELFKACKPREDLRLQAHDPHGASRAGEEGWVPLRLCNLVVPSERDVDGGLQAGGREGADRPGNEILGDCLPQRY